MFVPGPHTDFVFSLDLIFTLARARFLFVVHSPFLGCGSSDAYGLSQVNCQRRLPSRFPSARPTVSLLILSLFVDSFYHECHPNVNTTLGSPDCQRAAWTMPVCPHRQFCELSRRLHAAWSESILGHTDSFHIGEQALKEHLGVSQNSAFTKEEMRAFVDNSGEMLNMRPSDGGMSLMERNAVGERGTG